MAQKINVKLYLRSTSKQQQPIEQLKMKVASYVSANNLKIEREFIDYVDTRPNFFLLIALIQPNEIILTPDLEMINEHGKELIQSLIMIKQKNAYLHTFDFGLLDPNKFVPILESFYNILRKNLSWLRDAELINIGPPILSRGRSPFGYKNLGKGTALKPVESQQKILVKIFQMHKEGLNYSQIAQKLNDVGDNMRMNDNKKSNPKKIIFFNAESIKRILYDHGLIKANYKRKPVLVNAEINENTTENEDSESEPESEVSLLKIPTDRITIDDPLSIDNSDSETEKVFPINNDCGID